MLFKYLSSVFLVFFLVLQAQASTLPTVNLAEQQGMLSQRIVKINCQIALNIAPDLSRHQLTQAMRDFEENLKLLEKTVSGPNGRAALDDLRAAWLLMQSTQHAEFDAPTASLLDRRADAVLQAAEQLVAELHDQSNPVISRWISTAGRQRMLSQRLAKAYMLRQLGPDSARIRQELESTSYEFSGAMISMQKRTDNSPAIQAALAELAMQWEWLHSALAIEGASDYRLVVAAGSDLLLELADKLTALYSLGEQ